jgi:hypothetical protein
MATQGPLSAGTGASSGGGTAWGSPTVITASDDSKTTATNIPAASGLSATLISSQHGFTIPAGTIDGITVEIERSGDNNNIQDSSVVLRTGGAAVGSDKAATGVNWPTAGSEAYATYGGVADTWGRSWSVAEVNSTDFGVGLVALNANATNTRTARVDHIRITVTYTASGGGATGPTIGGQLTRSRLIHGKLVR